MRPRSRGVAYADRVRHLGADCALLDPSPVPTGPLKKVSVVIPCYNYAHLLPAAVGSVLAQSGVDVEVIVVDDDSPDGTADVAARLSSQDARVTVVTHATNKGHITTYNDGLDSVTGDYCALVSADDLVAPGALGRAVRLLEAQPSVGFVYGTAVPFSGTPPEGRSDVRSWSVWSGDDWTARRCRRPTNSIRSPEVVVRTSVQRRAGGYRHSLPQSGDLEMWLRLASLADVGRVVGADQAFYRIHTANMHTAVFESGTGEGMLVDLENRLAAFSEWERWMRTRGLDVTGPVAEARVSLARESLVLACRAYRWAKDAQWPVAELRLFAQRATPLARSLPEWRALDRHQGLGSVRVRRSPAFRVSDVLDQARHRATMRREAWTGV